jgi:hypothetical protein
MAVNLDYIRLIPTDQSFHLHISQLKNNIDKKKRLMEGEEKRHGFRYGHSYADK